MHCSGKIIQRFPERDWPDTPFIESLELFCQPQGWALSTERQEPKFFVSVLTDIDAKRHYCAVLCFNEAVSITPSNQLMNGGVRGVGPPVPLITHHSIMYAPKCLVLISTLDYFETFRNCMGIVYTVYMEGLGVSMETLIGNMVGYVQVPPPGGPQVRFSIGAGDRQALQPPASPTLPVTGTTVLSLFNQLGIKNVLVLFCAALTEHKILFHSQSYNRLTESCHALKALLYPFKYSHVYIPILPASLVEVLSTPTPFIMGVHSHLQHDVVELMDVIVADLDGGSIRVPESLTVSLLPEPFWSQTHAALSKVLHPDLSTADNAFPSSAGIRASPHIVMDKEIRAVFMRMFAELLQGYRSCLTIIRIHSKPVITFHKASFLGNRGMVDNEFVGKVLDCMFFTTFVTERGPPGESVTYGMTSTLALGTNYVWSNMIELGQQLYSNENPNPQPFVAKIPKPTEGSFTRIHQPVFPHIDVQQVQSIIDEGTAKKVKIPQKVGQPRIVPMGPHISSLQSGRGLVSSSARRLEVMRNCVNCIFENKISDARKTFPAVLRALKSKAARLALCTELSHHVQGNKAVLEHQQFDLVVRLMNCALQAIHYANRMVFLRVPIDVNAATHRRTFNERDTASNSITNSMAESDSLDAESGFEDQEQSDREASVVRFVARFVDKVCTEGGVTEEHIKSLHQMIPGVVAMHVEMLDAVYKESKRLPPIQKSTIFIRRDAYRQSTDGTYKPDPRYTEIVHGQPKILLPSLVPGEEVVYEGLRVYLLPDGREDATGGSIGGPILLPAEGALFLTNYRLIFKGLPTDPYACEQVVVRSMPVSSITREKRVPANQHPGPMDQWLSEGLQIRSNTFQLIKVAFDEEVSPESIETMRKMINRLRHPPYIMNLFAFVGHSHVPQTPSRQQKDKPGYGTLRGFAKKTLMKTAKVAGLKSGKGNKRNKYHFPSNNKSMTSPGRMSLAQMANMDLSNENLAIDDDLSVVDEHEASGLSNGSTGQLSVGGLVGVREVDSKTLEKLSERSYHKDYMRLGLGSLASNSTTVPPRTKSDFRITTCNVNYQLCRSYPALLSVPPNTGDDSIHRLARCYRQNRLPVITWRHPRNKALLLRGASFHGKGVMSMLKGPPTTTGTTSEVSYSVEQEKYLAAVVQATPLSVLREGSTWRLTGSSPSINSLVLAAGGATLEVPPYHPTYPTLTPEVGRKSNPLSKAMNTLRTSGGKGTGRMGRWGSLRGARPGVPSSGGVGGTLGTLRHHPTSTPALRSSINTGPRLSVDSTDMGTEAVQSFHKAALYVFGEKTQIKVGL
ncbi:putative myotubularin-related protein 13 [Penaeus vannamei]|uniref:Putative myotubularin-related protein 13 n=1 Tax=Penaeus vannamei TaxID=6689 RepID=A0A3R7QH33_PENVA|nr:putative myotubularin-related protein 13 [Penaeus vannamei]